MTTKGLILELFPGAGLFGKAFEAEGWCVVRGPDILWGGDIHDFHAAPGYFDGIIGGPPCQVFSEAARFNGTSAVNLIPEFLRVVDEAKPHWAVMENVQGAIPFGPHWPRIMLEDFDCGGLTFRERPFWFYGIPPCIEPPYRIGKREHSVMASNWKVRTGQKNGGTHGLHQKLTPAEAARLQGYAALDERIMSQQPGGVTPGSRRCLAIHMLGNGVPRAMGEYIAKHVTKEFDKL